ncbi:MAG: enoyl-CoA hydratase/isomerase family protein [Cellvibrionales bacterium]|nr:enoyl-CoA hydratase/isomerase family protein [Cellvibrionales bacterium]
MPHPPDYQHILTDLSGGILSLTLNRPDRKNALNLGMYAALAEQLSTAQEQGARVILIQGTAGCFTSGNDLADFAADTPLDENHPGTIFMHRLLACPLPIIAAVEGLAIGIGTTMLLHCDLIYAHPQTRFKLPFVSLGLVPEFAASHLLPLQVGHRKACEWLLLADFFSAAEALDAGLLNAVIEAPAELAQKQAQKMAALPPAALRTSKSLIKAAQHKATKQAMQAESPALNQALKAPEFAEAITAFKQKRPPNFSTFN